MSMLSLVIFVLQCITRLPATDLVSSNQDITLTLALSPYHVTQNVGISNGATINIENGVDIIFDGDYTITVQGNINCGCGDFDTQGITNIIGIADQSSFVSVTAGINGYVGSIEIQDGGYAIFCNTKFDGLKHAIKFDSAVATGCVIDNCEFSNLRRALYTDIPVVPYMTDTLVTNALQINRLASGNYDRCRFQTINSMFDSNYNIPQAYGNYNVSISNTEISNCIGTCLNIQWYSNYLGIDNNIIDGAGDYGISLFGGYEGVDDISITNNIIRDSTLIGIYLKESGVKIENNQFINNTVDIRFGADNMNDTLIFNNTFDATHTSSIIREDGWYFRNCNISYNTWKDIDIGSNTLIELFDQWNDQIYLYIGYNDIINVTAQNHIQINYFRDYTIEYNNFLNNTIIDDGHGIIDLQNTVNGTISHNLFKYNLMLETNTIWDNKVGLFDSGTDTGLTFIHNSFIDNFYSVVDAGEYPPLLWADNADNHVYKYNIFGQIIDVNNLGAKRVEIFHFWNAGDVTIQYNDFNSYAMDTTNNRRRLMPTVDIPISSDIFIQGDTSPPTPNPTFNVQYNNFYDHNHVLDVIELNNYDFNINANNNYYAGMNKMDNISIQMYDGCGSSTSSTGYVIFWPIYVQPVDFTNPASPILPTECHWDNVVPCSYNSEECYLSGATDNPTTDAPSLAPTFNNPTTADPTTNTPSISPTNDPNTESPSTAPTSNNPTQYPSINPSVSPSMAPSRGPTLFGYTYPPTFTTNSPTTSDPTRSPSEIPTSSPIYVTQMPSDTTQSPSITPSISPTESTDAPTLPPSATVVNSPSNSDQSEGLFLSWDILYIIIGCLVFCCIAILLIIFIRNKKNKAESDKSQNRPSTTGINMVVTNPSLPTHHVTKARSYDDEIMSSSPRSVSNVALPQATGTITVNTVSSVDLNDQNESDTDGNDDMFGNVVTPRSVVTPRAIDDNTAGYAVPEVHAQTNGEQNMNGTGEGQQKVDDEEYEYYYEEETEAMYESPNANVVTPKTPYQAQWNINTAGQ